MRPKTYTVGAGESKLIPLNFENSSFHVSIGVVESGTDPWTLDHTYDDIQAAGFTATSANWFTKLTSTGSTNEAFYDGIPVSAVRIRNTATGGSDTVSVVVLQAGVAEC